MKNKHNAKTILIVIPLAAIALIVGVPLIINESYKMNSGYTTCWGASDVLSYYGTILGATATIIAVIMTIRFSKKQQREERIIGAKPWLSSITELLNSHSEIEELQRLNSLYVFINGDAWGVSKSFPHSLREENYAINQIDCVIKYILSNVGGNSATNICITINGQSIIPPFALAKDKSQCFAFVLPLESGSIETKYHIVFEYGDTVSKTVYTQEETVIVKKGEHGVTLAQGMNDLLTAPKTP